ncbi:hypothetical protein GTO91_17320 [Heliobacterium undosum]|uniref:HNH nuclease domain-containing protein n=1 Tax=Heliomicrobium undosum TaxID=121734 RepID=A0A845L9K1_9FIRM|nr:HNH endonuclease [Heliomicrobium undosum]MZP31454.1 hypothetical protein [Heliomicrobium undosum]
MPKWDNEVAKKIISKIVRPGEVSEWLGMKSNWAYNHISKNRTTGKWLEEWSNLDELEQERINEMIEKQEFTYNSNELGNNRFIAIRKYFVNIEAETAKYLIFARNGERIVCVTDLIPREVENHLTVVWPWDVRLKDFELAKKFNILEIFGRSYVCPDYITHVLMSQMCRGRTREFQRSYIVSKCARDFGHYGYLRKDSWDIFNGYKEKIKFFADSDNNVYFPDLKEPLVSQMTSWANKRGGSLNQLISRLGYQRIYHLDNPLQDIVIPFFRPENVVDEEVISHSDWLSKLKNIQSMIQLEKSTEKYRQRRRRELADLLKQKYMYRCQLCGEENGAIPIIEKDDGTHYVEMHHIVALADTGKTEEARLIADEWGSLDTYKNALVVCPHHHRYLHYHHGGFKNLIFENGPNGKEEVFIKSRKGTRIRVVENWHLGKIGD